MGSGLNVNVRGRFTAFNSFTRLTFDPGSGPAVLAAFMLPSLRRPTFQTLEGKTFLLLSPMLTASPPSPQLCPVCRSVVDHVQHVYLPTCTSLLSLTLTDNHQHRAAIPAAIRRDLAPPLSEYEPKTYHT